MARWAAAGCLARTLGTYVAAGVRDLAGTLRRPHPGTPPPGDAPPSLGDLDRAGAEWAPISTDPAEAFEATHDNGYVVVRRSDDPYGPVWVVDEDVWDAFLTGADEDAPIEGM